MSICRVELDPSNRNGDQPIIKTLHRYFHCDVEVHLIDLSRVLPVLRNKAKMGLVERLEILHGNANLVIWSSSMNVSYLYHKEPGDMVDHIVRIMEQDLLVPLRADVPLDHE